MKTGKLADAVYGRSIHKKLKDFPDTIMHGAAGDDCAMFSLEQEELTKNLAVFTKQIIYAGEHCGKYGVYSAVNAAIAAGCRPMMLTMALLLPKEAQEEQLRQIVEEAKQAGMVCRVPMAEATASVSKTVCQPLLTVTVLAAAKSTALLTTEGTGLKARAGMDIVMTKWAGLEGSAILADICREELLTRYPAYMVEEAAEFDQFLSVEKEAALIKEYEICAACAAAEGGIFRALWTLGTNAGAGLEVALKKIPIRQETVEICNHLDLNPYELAAGGSLLMIVPQGEALVMELEKNGITAAVIGTVTDNNDRVIVNGEERRFLEPAKADEIFKITER